MNEFEKSSFVIGVLVLMTIALNTGIASATIIRVPADYPAIQAGINAASIGDTVLVAPGTYFENIYFNGRNILVGSLFITTGDTSYITRTVIDGNKNESVVAFNHVDSTAILSGFTITNGSSDWDGGGINCYDHASPSLENLRILNNSAAHAGGGISCRRNCNPYLKNVEIRGNSAIDNGGGLVCHENSRPTLEEVMILNNTSNDHGGGMAFNNSDPFLRNVIVTNNYAKWSGGIHCRQSSPNLANVIISQNSAEWDGGFVCWDNSNPNLINVTITGNSANGTSGGIFCGKNSNPILLNAILWNNSPQEIALNLSSITISYSNVRGGAAGTGNIDQNPLFADEGSGDYHLQLGSPCIDAGDPDLDGDGITWQTDPDDQDPDYTRMDMGAYYYNLSSTIRITTGDIVNDGGDSRNVSWSDYDNDGNMDLFVSNFNLPEGQNNFLYRNNGDGSFIKITEGDIVNDGGISSGSSWGDYDNDGDSDLFVVNFGNNFLYANNGDGSFTKIAEGDIVNDGSSSHGASWGDYDNDGDLDLFVANWNNENNFLYANNGDGTFTRITTGTIVNDGGNSTGCIWGDYDNDGYLDLFVANEGNNFLYANNGDGGFNKITTGSIVTDGGSSLSSSFGDYDNDGDLDLFVANKNDENDLLYSNNGDGTFTKITTGDIVNDGSNSHGANWGDYDNDGYLDLFVANHGGNNFLYRNNGDGTFNKVTAGHIVNDGIFSQGSSWADYDNDGDLDLFVGNVGNNFLYANNGYSNNWINIKCNGTVSNRSAVGTKVRVKATINGRAVWQLNEISGQTGGGFGGQNSLNTEFGLGDATIIDSLKIEWSSGIVRIFMNIPVNQFLTVRENNSPVVANEIPDINLTINGDSFTRDLNTSPFVFTDPDGEELSFSAFSSNDSVATATVNGSLL
ncbi:MAG: FG-GAP-like repeat-containing protein, partial [bacterium]